jgi:hypothetical protein
MQHNVNHPPPKQQPTAKGLRQRRSSELRKVVFDVSTQKPIEIRDGNHTEEFYIRYALLPIVTKSK